MIGWGEIRYPVESVTDLDRLEQDVRDGERCDLEVPNPSEYDGLSS